jgi:alpha-1,3-rhamnosyltransferase
LSRVVESSEWRRAAVHPLVSVIIPSYNHARYIGETINSVCRQTLFDIELIIIDDGSADNSIAVIEKAISRFSDRRIVFVARENRGLCRTLNEGLELAKGKYFSYVGSDDFWEHSKLEKQTAAIEAAGSGYGASFCDAYLVDADSNVVGRYGLLYRYRGGEIYRDLVWSRFHPPSPTNLFRRDIVTSVGGFNEDHFIEDKDLWIRISRNHKVAFVNEPLAFYRTHGDNTSLKNLDRMHEYNLDVLDRACKADPSLERYRGRLQSKLDAMAAANLFGQLELTASRRAAWSSLLGNPREPLAWRTLILSMLGKEGVRLWRQIRRRIRET